MEIPLSDEQLRLSAEQRMLQSMRTTITRLMVNKFGLFYLKLCQQLPLTQLERRYPELIRAATSCECATAAVSLANEIWSNSSDVTAVFVTKLTATPDQPFKRAHSIIFDGERRTDILLPEADDDTPQWEGHYYTIVCHTGSEGSTPILLAASPSNWGIAGPDPLQTVISSQSLPGLLSMITDIEGGITPPADFIEDNLPVLVPCRPTEFGQTVTLVTAACLDYNLQPQLTTIQDTLH